MIEEYDVPPLNDEPAKITVGALVRYTADILPTTDTHAVREVFRVLHIDEKRGHETYAFIVGPDTYPRFSQEKFDPNLMGTKNYQDVRCVDTQFLQPVLH